MSSHFPISTVHCIVVSAGVGSRFGSALPKQYTNIADKTVLQHSILALSRVEVIKACYLVIAENDRIAKTLDFALPIFWVTGGAERINSVWHGVQKVLQDVQKMESQFDDHWVLIHDAGRPCVKAGDVTVLIDTVCQKNHQGGGLLAVPVRDTVKVATQQDSQKYSQTTLDRSQLWLAQTPQIFPLATLYRYLEQAIAKNIAFTDEASLFEYFGQSPMLVAGSHSNIKLTFPEDLQFAKAFLQG